MLWFKLIHPEDAARVMANHATLLKNGFIDHEYRIITSAGEIKWVVNRVWIIKDEKGNPIRMDGITKDATVRRKAIEKLHDALEKEHTLNLQLIRREEELAAHEEELQQVNQQLSTTIAQLKKSEKALRKAQHLAKIGNFECDLLNKQTYCSDEAEIILGIDISKLTFSSQRDALINIVHPEDKPRVLAFFLKVLSGKRTSGKLQFRIMSEKQEIKYIIAYTDKIQKDQNEKVALVSGIIQDVTGTVLSIHQLKEERVRSELALWGGDLGLWDWDIQTNAVTYNQRWAEMLGYSLSEIVPTADTWKNLIHPEDEQNVFASINAHLEGKTPFFQSEHRLRSKSGDWIWILDSGRVIKWDSAGKPVRAIGTHKDITDKKLAEEEVRKLALVAQKTENGVIITDAHGITEWVNEGFTRITGFTNQEMKGKKPGDLLQGPETDPATKTLMHERFSKGQEFHSEILNYTKTGEKYWLRLDVQPIVDQQGRLQRFIAIQTDITQRKQVEQQLNFQANILRNVKESVIVTDLQGKVMYYNQGAEAIFGYTAQEMLGHELVSLYLEPPSPEERKKIWDTLTSAQSFNGEWLGKHKNNTLVWVHVTTTLLVNELGEPIGLIGVSKDITDRKKAENELKRSEAYLQSIFDATVQAYFLLDPEYKIIKFNKTASDAIKRIHGKELRIGDNIIEYSDINALEDFKRNIQKAFTGENVFTSRELFFANGQQRWFEVQYLPARNEHNEIYGVAFVSLDITQRKLTEIALLKSYQEVQNFRNALYTSASISVTDTSGIITEVNEAFCITSGYTREELLGHTHKLINSGFHNNEFFEDLWKSISAGKPWKGEIKNKAKNGAFYWVDTSITPILDENGHIIQYLSVRYLVTERKKAEEDREALIKNLTRFAFMTAHNLRGPLARVLGLVSIINLDDPADPINKTALEKLTNSAQELDAVIYKMIDMVNLSDLKR
jgi:PAS domain S-box-containing protein